MRNGRFERNPAGEICRKLRHPHRFHHRQFGAEAPFEQRFDLVQRPSRDHPGEAPVDRLIERVARRQQDEALRCQPRLGRWLGRLPGESVMPVAATTS